MGERYDQKGMGREALDALVEALRLDPEDPIIHNDLEVILVGLGERERARECFRRALQLAPDMPEARENLHAADSGIEA